MELFTITCTTCRARLKVREMAAIGQILACPKCDSMVQVAPPPGWQPPTESAIGAPERTNSPPSTGSTITLRIPPPSDKRRASAPTPTKPDANGGSEKPKRRVAAAAAAIAPLTGVPTAKAAAAPVVASPSASAPAQTIPATSSVPATAVTRVHAILELCRQHWLLASLVPAASLALVVGGWMLWGGSGNTSLPEDASPEIAEAGALPTAAPVSVDPLPDARVREFTHWLPSQTVEVVRLPVGDLQKQPGVEGLLRRAIGAYDQAVDPLTTALRLPKESIRRFTWATTQVASDPSAARTAQGIAIIEFAEPISQPSTLFEGCQPLDLKLGEGFCHQPPAGGWPHPFVLVDKRTILSGPLELLRELHDRDNSSTKATVGLLVGGQKITNHTANGQPSIDELPKLASAALARAIELAGPDSANSDAAAAGTQAILAVDLAATRQLSLSPALAMLDHWPEGRDDWQTLRDLPAAMLVRLVLREGVEIDAALVCDERTAAEKVHASLDQLAGACAAAITSERESLSQRLVANSINAATADKLDLLFARSAAALTARQLQTDDTVVWIRTRIAADPPTLATAATVSVPAIESRRLEIAETLDEGNQQRLLTGLAGYEKAEQGWPLGAGGAALLPPENRLSWLATMLPYYGHLDWHRELNFGRPWNDTANRGVTRLPLEFVVNPALGISADAGGFPVTHYVGVSGLGLGSGQLDATDPKAGVFGFQRRVARNTIGDGATNTIAILGVSGRLGPWAAGGDATVRPLTKAPYVNGPDGFGSGQPNGMLAGMADGSVRFLSKDIDPRVIEQLATINGRESVQIESLARPRPATLAKGNSAVPTKPQPGDIGTATPALKPLDSLPAKVPEVQANNAAATPFSIHIDARLNEKVPAIRFGQTTLAELVDFLGQLAGLEITLDPQALAEAQVQPDEALSVDLKNTTVRDVLESVLAERGLGFVVQGNQVLVTNARRQQAVLAKATYEVADLTGGDPQAQAQLAALVQRLVEPSSWREAGGKGSLEIVAGRLVVEQNASVQRQVLSLCEKLRVARGKAPLSSPGQKTPPSPKSPPGLKPLPPGANPLSDQEHFALETRFAQAKPRLDAPVTANFKQPTPLAQVLAYLRQGTGTQFLVDGPSLAALGLSRESTVTLVADKRPLDDALHGMLDPLKLTVRIIDGRTLQITSRGAWKDRLELEFYPAADLLGAELPDKGKSAAELLERVKSQLAPATWNDAGGPGVIEFDSPSGFLLVLQTQDVQIRLEEQLDAWRRER